MIKPRCLKKWDKVATVSLSWGWPWAVPERYLIGKKQIEEKFGVELVEMTNTMQDPTRVYDHPEERAKDLMDAFRDPTIKGIFSTIWGDDSIRILPYIDFDVIRNNPKVFMGYSDTTITHFICFKAGIVSFYGPSIMAGFGENGWLFPYMVDSVHKAIFSSEVIWEVSANKDGWTNEFLPWNNPENQKKKRNLFPASSWRWLQWEGKVIGKLLWGCVDVFPFIIGTSIWPSVDEWKNKILFLEPSEEKISDTHFERIVRNLGSQGVLHVIKGIIVGRAQMDYQTNTQLNYDKQLIKIVSMEFGLKDLPIVTNMDFWHTDPMFVIPVGIEAQLDCDNKIFLIMENPCV